MRARGRLVTAVAGGRTVATALRSEAPVLLRAAPRANHLDVHLVGGAAGPLGGDDLHLDVDIGAGSAVVVRSVAAQLAQPDPRGRSSTASTAARIATGACLDWCPEPVISVAGSDHRMTTRLVLEPGAVVRWSDTIVLGRTGEPAGHITSRLRVEVAGEPLLDHELLAGRHAHAGPGANGAARRLTSTVIVGPDAPPEPRTNRRPDGTRTATLPLRDGAALVVRLTP